MDNKNINIKLMEKFGELEQLCNQIYRDHHGVTIYIEEMKAINMNGEKNVPNWDRDLKKLIEIRDKRNKLSHGEVQFDKKWASKEDVEYAERFKKRILNQTDPLSTNKRAEKAMETERIRQNYTISKIEEPKEEIKPAKKTKNKMDYILVAKVAIIFYIIIAALIVLLYK